jgi:hypothetical protein
MERALKKEGFDHVEVVAYGTKDDVNLDDIPVVVINRDDYRHEQISLFNNENMGAANGHMTSMLTDITKVPVKATVYAKTPAEAERLSFIAYFVLTGVTRSILSGYDKRFMGAMMNYWTSTVKSQDIPGTYESTISVVTWAAFNTNIEIYGNISVKEINVEIERIK